MTRAPARCAPGPETERERLSPRPPVGGERSPRGPRAVPARPLSFRVGGQPGLPRSRGLTSGATAPRTRFRARVGAPPPSERQLVDPGKPARSERRRPTELHARRPGPRARVEAAVAPGHDPLPGQHGACRHREEVRLVTPPRMGEDPVAAPHRPRSRRGPDAVPGRARRPVVDSPALAWAASSRSPRRTVRSPRRSESSTCAARVHPPGACPARVDPDAVRRSPARGGAATRAVVEEARRTGRRARGARRRATLHAGLDSLEAEHAVGTAGQPDAAPCLLECARADLRGERAGCAVGDPAREVQAAGRVRWFPGSRRALRCSRERRRSRAAPGASAWTQPIPARTRELAVEPRGRLGTAKAVGGLGPAAGEDEEGEPVRGRPPSSWRARGPAGSGHRRRGLARSREGPTPDASSDSTAPSTACGDRATENAGGAPGPARRGDRSLESVGDDRSGEPDRGRPGREHGRCPAAGDRPARCDEPVV